MLFPSSCSILRASPLVCGSSQRTKLKKGIETAEAKRCSLIKPCRDFHYLDDFYEEAFRYFLDSAKISAVGMPTEDRKELKGNLMENVKQAMIFLKQHLSVRYEIKGLKRQEFSEIPEAALREAILNAVMHRDYHFDTAWITLEIYKDRVEISDPGGLPPGMRPEDLGKKSVHRNKMIADLFHRIGEVEKAGSGINRIRDIMTTSGLSEPKFEFTSFFTIIFDRKLQVTPQVTPQVRKMLEACKEPRSRAEILHILGLSAQSKKSVIF